MKTKTGGWTSHLLTKIICFVLILAFACFGIISIMSMFARADDTGIPLDIVLVDIETNQYFYQQHMYNAYYHASIPTYFSSEEAIVGGQYLDWRIEESGYAVLGTPSREFVYATLSAHDDEWFDTSVPRDTPENRMAAEQRAVRDQLRDYRNALDFLENESGIIYYLSDVDGVVHTNIHGQHGTDASDITLYTSRPVYIAVDAMIGMNTSHSGHGWFRSYPPYPYYEHPQNTLGIDTSKWKIYMAYNYNAVIAQNNSYFQARHGHMQDLARLIASVVLFLVLLVILLLGAGRRRGVEGIHLVLVDRLYLDIGITAVAGWTVLAIVIADSFSYTLFQFSNYTVWSGVLSATAIIILTPFLFWLMSFVKHVKKGRFWRHTLIFALPYACIRSIRSLWAGFPLTPKVILIAVASFASMIIVGVIGAESGGSTGIWIVFFSLLFTGAATFLLLRYAKRIYTLKQGAINASGGAYDTPIDAGKGELGVIADSINNISAGINTAVEERMKSERLKTELITNVSHDIRTPLTSIITYTDLLRREGLNSKEAPEYLDVLASKSQRLKTLTDELFEAAKAATGNIDVNISVLDITSLVNQVLGELDSAVKSSGLDLRVNLPEKLSVKADGKLMWRVLENLLSNVFKYALPGSRVYMDAETENGMSRIDLKNVSAAELNVDPSELMDRFKRGDQSRSDGGSGLGLSIVQSFVAAQGGRFELSIDGDLFKASVYLPRAV